MDDFTPGQRWICDAELSLGLGTVMSCDIRSVTILFLSCGETRTYSKQSAPLSRVSFAPGDLIPSHDGWKMRIKSLQVDEGVITYLGEDEAGEATELHESQLDNFIQLNRPADRLFNGQLDASKLYQLRCETIHHQYRQARSPLQGLTGARTTLIPHQLYIAHEVANRYAPRVLLADEVGLGKTIEAGLILHQQLLTERAQRVLIVVPESLAHQWLVEMLRRFNLSFSLFDEERCLAIEESSGLDNPFSSEQQVLCSLGFLVNNPKRALQALSEKWDLLVVDEAHHLQWSPQQASPEYQLIAQLAAKTAGVLLLTATPEQLGKMSHFARLRLLDPDRFPDYERFIEDERGYQSVASLVQHLLSEQAITSEQVNHLKEVLGEGEHLHTLQILQQPSQSELHKEARDSLVNSLLDRHGTGRVLFRNTRATIKGFPAREGTLYPLPLPPAYAEILREFENSSLSDPQQLLSPEQLYRTRDNPEPWYQFDPRITWLQERLTALFPSKILVITASAHTALEIAEALRIQSGTHAAVFHEGMGIIERDRAAAYFADETSGGQLLICSEIGSEGRNFQFAHHLVLFDLPFNPDLLEQRIGRLDRIGQSQTIQIHIPFLENSAQAVMASWYQQGLNAFAHTCPAAQGLFSTLQPLLIEALHQVDHPDNDLSDLIATTQKQHQQLNKALQQGRDQLLEINSCRPKIAQALVQQAADREQPEQLHHYLESLFDCYGVESEEHDDFSYLIRPGDHMQGHFPGLLEEGMLITYQRNIALYNEDMHFLTWEHPMVQGAMEMISSSELGNSCLIVIKQQGLPAGRLLLETHFLLEGNPGIVENNRRYLPPTPLRVLVDGDGNDFGHKLSYQQLNQLQLPIDKETSAQIIKSYHQEIRAMIKTASSVAESHLPERLAREHQQSKQSLQRELDRLEALKPHTPHIREEELEFFRGELNKLERLFQTAQLRLDSLRVIVSS